MKPNHLSEIQIQQYALDKINRDTDLIEHIELCESCKTRAANYRLLFYALSEQPKSVLDFNAADLVLAKLPRLKKAAVRHSHWLYILVFAAFGSIGTPLYLLKEDIQKMLNNTRPAAIFLAITTALLILVFQSIEIFRKYRKQLKALNY